MPERHAVAGDGSRAKLPAWACWASTAAPRPWTVGIEEEVMLLDARTGSVANRIDDVLAGLPPLLASNVSAETHACVLELKTAAHPSVADVVAELTALRRTLNTALRDRVGLRAAAAGTHPLALRSEVAVTTDWRYRDIVASMRSLAYREPTMALHVHVAVADGDTAVRALDGLRSDLPLLLALSANSPFWRGADSGFASVRTPIFSMFPRTGIPRPFGSYANYVGVLERLVRCGAIPDPSFVWWDARLQPRLGTVEVRIMDAQSRIADVAALTAFVQCLVRRHADAPPPTPIDPEILAENRFLAARDGVRANLIGSRTARRAVHDALADLLDACRPHAAALQCLAQLTTTTALANDPGDARQRRLAERDGIAYLPQWLSCQYAPRRHAADAA